MKRLRFIRSTCQIVMIAMLVVIMIAVPADLRSKKQGTKEAQLDGWVAEITGTALTPEEQAILTERERHDTESDGQKALKTYIEDNAVKPFEWIYIVMASNRKLSESGWSYATILEYMQWRLHVWLGGILFIVAVCGYFRTGNKIKDHQECKDTEVTVRGMDYEMPFSREPFVYLMMILVAGTVGAFFGRMAIFSIDAFTAWIVSVRYLSFVSEGGRLIEVREDEDRWYVRLLDWFTKRFHVKRRKQDDSGLRRVKRGPLYFLKRRRGNRNRPKAEPYVPSESFD